MVQVGKKILIGTAGFLVLLLGIILIFIPGPAIIVIPLGLAILATQFTWARSLLQRLRDRFPRARRIRIPGEDRPAEG